MTGSFASCNKLHIMKQVVAFKCQNLAPHRLPPGALHLVLLLLGTSMTSHDHVTIMLPSHCHHMNMMLHHVTTSCSTRGSMDKSHVATALETHVRRANGLPFGMYPVPRHNPSNSLPTLSYVIPWAKVWPLTASRDEAEGYTW